MASNLWRKITDATGPDAGIHHDHQLIGTEFGDLRMFTDHRVEQLRKLFIGTGNSIQVENIQVQWPSGKTENFGTLASNAEYLLVEGSKAAFPLDNHDPDSIGADGSLKLNTRQTSNRPDSLHASQGIPGHE